MAELEIHHEEGHHPDPLGQKIGVLAATLAVMLAIAGIESHRTHTAAIIDKSTANDEWAHYQAARVKYHNLELGQNLLAVLDAKGPAADKMAADYTAQLDKYDRQAKDIQNHAQQLEAACERDEDRALRYDIGEGLLEIGVVLVSLYFISKKMMFPVIGAVAGVAGVVIALTGLLVG
jgi:hypothetical protein